MEISQIPQEKEDHHRRVSLLETQLSQLLNDDLALQCNALTACVKSLEDSLENSTALSFSKTVQEETT